ncbi:MAG: FHA domain-containing protein, partial [Armatimonadia bacterium]
SPGACSGVQLLVESCPDKGKSFMAQPETTIGREDGRTVRLSDDTVSRKQATLRLESGKWMLQNESTQGTFVNGSKVESAELKSGDVIRVGATVLKFQKL